MSKKTYNKLVRDKIPEIINKDPNTKQVKYFKLTEDNSFKVELLEKLLEEVEEFRQAFLNGKGSTIDELADIKTVLDTIVEQSGFSYEDIESVKMKKDTERGRFNNRIFLQYVETYK